MVKNLNDMSFGSYNEEWIVTEISARHRSDDMPETATADAEGSVQA